MIHKAFFANSIFSWTWRLDDYEHAFVQIMLHIYAKETSTWQWIQCWLPREKDMKKKVQFKNQTLEIKQYVRASLMSINLCHLFMPNAKCASIWIGVYSSVWVCSCICVRISNLICPWKFFKNCRIVCHISKK